MQSIQRKQIGFPNQDAEVLQVHANHSFRFNAEQLYKAAGVAIPVFSLRSENGLGVGEFTDIKKLADWAHKTNLSIIQILPINDTTANYSWTDSYPYAAISVYAIASTVFEFRESAIFNSRRF